MTTGLTVAGQAERLGLPEDLIRSVLTTGYLRYTLTGDQLTDEQVDELDDVVNRGGILAVPGLYGYTGDDC